MPELPDVEIFKEYLKQFALKKKIEEIEVFEKKIIRQISEKDFKKKVLGSAFTEVSRHGKYLFATLSNGSSVVFHFGMTGSLYYFKKEKTPPHTRLLFDFKDGSHLAFIAIRLFERVTLADSKEAFIKKQRLGPDALSISGPEFMKLISKSKLGIKTILMQQHLISGIGNIYSDEILFQTKLHPNKKSLTPSQIKKLYLQMRKVLAKAIQFGAARREMPKNWLIHYRSSKKNCPLCGTPIKKIEVISRPTYFCPDCQKL